MAGNRVESVRTSSTAYLDNDADEVVRAIVRRAALATGYPAANIEPLQVVRYRAGEEYKPHYDFGFECDLLENLRIGRRHVTLLVYLNDLPADDLHAGGAGAGGHTSFPLLSLRVRPRLGTALVFNDCADDGASDRRTLHGGEPPAEGVLKYAINIWIRANAFAQPVADLAAAAAVTTRVAATETPRERAATPTRRDGGGAPPRVDPGDDRRAAADGAGVERPTRPWWRRLLSD
jgi:hypothetical protein